MKRQQKEYILQCIGVVLITWSLLNIFFTVRDGSWQHVFWLSNHIGLVLGSAVLLRKSYWITAELALGFVGEMGWSVDYVGKILFDIHILGSTSYLFVEGYPSTLFFSTLQHLFIIPLGVWALWLLAKPEPAAWKGALFHACVLLLISFPFGVSLNLNCFLESCVSWIPTFPWYPLFWMIVYFGVFVIPIHKGIVYLMRKKSNPKSH